MTSFSEPLAIGKIPPEILDNAVFRKICSKDSAGSSSCKFSDSFSANSEKPRVLVAPGTGEDCGIVDIGNRLCVLSCDPITGASNNVGKLAVHVSCNDIASAGLRPFGLMITILLPPGSTPEDLDKVMADISETASELDVLILGGHTEVTDSVTRIVITTNVIAFSDSFSRLESDPNMSGVVRTGGAKPGDILIMTKTAGLEGTAVIAKDHADALESVLGKEMVSRAQSFLSSISVMKEGIIGGRIGVSAMHDVTEGGIFGAVYEIAEASGCGVVLEMDKIPVAEETSAICAFYGISPYMLISSGCMAITISEDKSQELLDALARENIKATVIGHMTENKKRLVVSCKSGEYVEEVLEPPKTDELYRV